MSSRLLPVLFAAAALALPASAAAAPPWSAPATVPGARDYQTPVVATPAGHVAMVSASPAAPPSEIVALHLDGTFGTPQPVGVAAALLTAYATDHVAVAGSTLAADGTIDDHSHVQVATGSPGGDLGPLRGLSGSTGRRAFALAGNVRGDLAVLTGDAGTERTVYLRRAGTSAFRVVLRIAVHEHPRGATVALGPKGDVLAVWEDGHVIHARHLGPTGHAGAIHRIGDGVQSQLQAAIDDEGRLEVAWETQRVSEGDASGPATVRYATAAPGHGFGAQRTVETVGATGTGHYVAAPGVRLVLDGPGRALLAWTGLQDGHFVTRAADYVHGHTGAPRTLSPAGTNAVLADAAADGAGAATVVWRTGVAGADPDGTGAEPVEAAHRAAGDVAFGAPELVSAPDETTVQAAVTLDAVTGRSAVVYSLVSPGAVRAAVRP